MKRFALKFESKKLQAKQLVCYAQKISIPGYNNDVALYFINKLYFFRIYANFLYWCSVVNTTAPVKN